MCTYPHTYRKETCLITLSCKGLCADKQNQARSCSAADLTRVVAIAHCELTSGVCPVDKFPYCLMVAAQLSWSLLVECKLFVEIE